MKYCVHCGYELMDDAKECPNCGRSVSNPVKTTTVYYVNEINGYAIAGFILSFFIPLLGLIFGGLGLSRSKEIGGEGRGFAIGALVNSGIYFLGGIIGLIIIFAITKRYQ